MSKAKQLMDVMMYVNAKRNFTAQEVADEFGVSVRTAHRYLTEISDMGVPLYTEQDGTGIPYLEDSRSPADPVR